MKQLMTALAVLIFAVSPDVGPVYAQAPPDPVDFRPFTDGRNWIVKEPLTYRVGISQDSVTVPRGFVTDFASIPPALQSIIQQNGPNLLPAVVHDYLYWKQTCTRAEADQIVLLAMTENKVSVRDREAIYGAVRAAGIFAWIDNARDRAANRIRIIPEDRIGIRANTIWPDYQQKLMSEGVSNGPDTAISSGFCARGSMTTTEALETP